MQSASLGTAAQRRAAQGRTALGAAGEAAAGEAAGTAGQASARNERGVVFFDPSAKVGPAVAAALAERGVIGRAMPEGDILGFAPPLCLTKEEADIVVDRTADAVKEVFAGLKAA